jgi:hypothetical protein
MPPFEERAEPAALTTQVVLREISMLRELIEARLDGMDRAIFLTQQYPTLLDKAIVSQTEKTAVGLSALERLHDERFHGVDRRFNELADRVILLSKTNKEMVDAALHSVRDLGNERDRSRELAISKSENAINEQYRGLSILLSEMRKSLDEKINVVNERQTSSEGAKRGGHEVWGYIMGAAGLALAAFSLFRGAGLVHP